MITILLCMLQWGQGGRCAQAHRRRASGAVGNAPAVSSDFLDSNPFLGPSDCVLLASCLASEHQVGIW